jgi:hypothetical protein
MLSERPDQTEKSRHCAHCTRSRPGGSLIATFLWLYTTVTVTWMGRHEQLGRGLA